MIANITTSVLKKFAKDYHLYEGVEDIVLCIRTRSLEAKKGL